MILVPDETPVTTPVEKPIDATAVSLLIQTPPELVSLSEIVDPTQTWVLPWIGPIAKDTIENRHAKNVRVNSLIMTNKFYIFE